MGNIMPVGSVWKYVLICILHAATRGSNQLSPARLATASWNKRRLEARVEISTCNHHEPVCKLNRTSELAHCFKKKITFINFLDRARQHKIHTISYKFTLS